MVDVHFNKPAADMLMGELLCKYRGTFNNVKHTFINIILLAKQAYKLTLREV